MDTPQPGPAEVLVRVHAAAITRDELDWAVDRLPAIPSYELSGVVAATGAGAEGVAVDDEVYALADFERDGAAAEYAVLASQLLAPKPQTLGHIESAAIPLPASAPGRRFDPHLSAGERVLIHGRPAVGSFAVQLAHGAERTSRNASERGASRPPRLGSDEVVDNPPRLRESRRPRDLVFDTAAGAARALPGVLREGGLLVSIAEDPVARARIRVEPNREQPSSSAASSSRDLRSLVDSVFPLADEARLRAQHGPGKMAKCLRVVDD